MKMEKSNSRGGVSSATKVKTSYLCIPRLRNNNSCSAKKKGLTPAMTLLERFREAVFRLIMLSAFSSSSKTAPTVNPDGSATRRSYHRPVDDHLQSQAVADCIEFIKKKAVPGDHTRDSSAAPAEKGQVSVTV